MSDSLKPELPASTAKTEINRRSLLKRGAAAGAVAAVGTTIAHGSGSAAPGAGSSSRSARHQADEKTLVVLDDIQGQNWLYFDPGKFYEINPSAGMNLIYEGLYNLPDGSKLTEFVPQLADGMPVYSDDKLTATIKLRQGVTFQNTGNPFTADDVVFSFMRLANLKGNPSPLFTDYLKSVEKVDAATIKLTLLSVNAALVGILSAMPLGILDSVEAKKQGGTDAADADQTDKLTDWLNSGHSVGTGPYACTAWDVSNEIVLEANPNYYGEKAHFDRIIFRNQSNSNTQLDSIVSGEADMAFSIDPDAVSRITPDSGLQLVQGPSLAIEYIAMNNDATVGGILAKKEIRQAIAKAIDYNGIINDLLGGGAVRPATIVPLGLLGADVVEANAYQTDLAAAQALFDSAGVPPTEITLTWGSGQATPAGLSRDTLAPKLKSDLEKIKGLTVKLNPMDPTQRLADYRAAKLQFTMSDWSPDYPDVHTYAQPFGDSAKGSAAKRVKYLNPQVDTLLSQGIAELDEAKRKDIYVQIQKILEDDAAFLVDFQPNYRSPASAKIQGAATHGIYILQLRNVTKTA
jgi:peptide/nickel transport system substrate-binding protein